MTNDLLLGVSWDAMLALQLGACIAAIGLVVSALEDLASYAALDDGGLLAWPVSRLRNAWTARGPSSTVMDWLLSAKHHRTTLVLLGIASLMLPITLWNPWLFTPLSAVVLLLVVLCNLRNAYGLDGSDQANIIILAAAFAASLAPRDGVGTQVCVWFVAIQSALSYWIAGIAKLRSPMWRNGSAIVGILSTEAYGHAGLHQWLRTNPRLAQVLCWGVILFECCFPLVFLIPGPFKLVLIGTAFLFHVATAVAMGLNNFFWGFVALYPALLLCAFSFSF
jgi:hypothetical protein